MTFGLRARMGITQILLAGGGDRIAPLLVSATVENAAPTKVVLTYSENLVGTLPLSSVWTVSGSTVSSRAAGATANIIELTLSAAVVYSDSKTVSYTKSGTDDLQDAAGNKAADLVAQAITNNVAGGAGFTDNFNRADSTGLGSPWVNLTGASDLWDVFSNQAKHTGGGADRTVRPYAADGSVQVDIVSSAGNPGVIFRATDSSNYWECTFYGTGVDVYKVVGGAAAAAPASYSGAYSTGTCGTLKVAFSGSSITVYVDGVSRITATDSALASATNVGVISYPGAAIFDNFVAT